MFLAPVIAMITRVKGNVATHHRHTTAAIALHTDAVLRQAPAHDPTRISPYMRGKGAYRILGAMVALPLPQVYAGVPHSFGAFANEWEVAI
jgi:hypothetical protein